MGQGKQAQRAAAGDVPAVAPLDVFNPDAPLTIAGREVTVREYGFFDGLAVAHRAAGFIADMHDICKGGDIRYAQIRRLFGVHRDVVVAIAAESAGVEPEWIAGLSSEDAEVFMSTWFTVNSGFFVREVVVEMREAQQRAAMTSTGGSSSPASPTEGSEASSSSPDSPSGS